MKKIVIILCMLSLIANSGCVLANNISTQTMTKEEIIKERKAREAAFEQKLQLTEAQKIQAKELRKKSFEQIKPIIDEIKLKKQEAEMVKRSRIAVQAQEEKLTILDAEIRELEIKAHTIRKQNMKDFEAILNRSQKKILKQMKKEGRQNFEQKAKTYN